MSSRANSASALSSGEFALPQAGIVSASIAEAAHPEAADDALVTACLAGNHNAFRFLVDRYRPLLLRVAGRWLRDGDAAADAVQEALIDAYRNLDRFQTGTSLRAWLARLTLNRVKMHLRAESRRTRRQNDWHAAAAQAAGAVNGAHTPDADGAIELERQAERMRAALTQLSDKQRACVTLRFDAEMSFAEVATAAGVSEAAARVHVHRGIIALRMALGVAVEANHEP